MIQSSAIISPFTARSCSFSRFLICENFDRFNSTPVDLSSHKTVKIKIKIIIILTGTLPYPPETKCQDQKMAFKTLKPEELQQKSRWRKDRNTATTDQFRCDICGRDFNKDWAKQELPNQFLITDPTSCQPGFNLKRSDWTILNRYRGHGICAASLHHACMRHKRRPTLCLCRQCRILSTNVHWRISLVGFRRFTLQMKIQSHGSTSTAYARRRRSDFKSRIGLHSHKRHPWPRDLSCQRLNLTNARPTAQA